ncbi:plant basic secretory protein, partial [Aspergillus violaceofuscus CBS 115571]
TSTSTPTTRTPALPTPKLLLQIHDLRHPSTTTFLTLIPNLASTLETALTTIIQTLYTCPPPQSPPPSASTNPPKTTPITFTPTLPPTRSITTFLRPIPGVAYTTGTDLDADHKEIHLSLAYIASCTERYADSSSLRAEIVGVLTHELVHCYQHTSPDRDDDTAPKPPGGLIEGIADFVRLKAGLAPPHWQRPRSAAERPEKWDQGYQHTAYFLAWLEEVRVGTGAVGLVNDRLLRVGYVGEDDDGEGEGDEEGKDAQKRGVEGFWRGLFGVGVEELWEEYGRYLDTLAGEG